uniref:Uncharacterized protein n=1 Tax=viral metagenome TaxID=1070528 RepID=A0A6H1ZNQ4_9ZZZZ
MNTRMVEIFPRKNYAADFTELIDINLVDPITQLVLTYEPDCAGGVGTAVGHPVRGIEKIELVDGSDVLFSLSGAEAHAVDFYHNWAQQLGKLHYLIGNYSKVIIPLNFGRFLFDEEFAIDPAKHNNLQLRIKGDIGACMEGNDDGYLTVMGHVFDQKTVSPRGFIMTKEVKQYTLANSSHEYTDLPLDFPYKQLFLRAQRYGTAPEDQIDTVKLSEDQDKKIPINGLTMTQIIDHVMGKYPTYHEPMVIGGNAAMFYYFCAPTSRVYSQVSEWRPSTGAYQCATFYQAGGRFGIIMSTAGPNWQVFIQGHVPHGVVPLLPDYSNDPADWFDVGSLKSLRLDVKGAADVGTAQTAEIIAQQVRPY